LGVGEFNDTSGDGKQLGQLSGTVTPRSRDQLEALRVRTDGDGLNEAVLSDAFGVLFRWPFCGRGGERAAWLKAARVLKGT
jgi:hypothetical protein